MRRFMLTSFALFLLFLSGTPASAYQDYNTYFDKWCHDTTRCMPSSEREDYKRQYTVWFSSLEPAEQLLELQLNRNLDRDFKARPRH
jgi:hypothetical protein